MDPAQDVNGECSIDVDEIERTKVKLNSYGKKTASFKLTTNWRNTKPIFEFSKEIIPELNNQIDLVNYAKEIKNTLQKLGMGRVILENSGNIGKSYRRHDEVGTPICITVDFETLDDDSVTVRDRDSMSQERISSKNLNQFYQKYFIK